VAHQVRHDEVLGDHARFARLAAAGAGKELFTSDAIAILHEAASGSLRDIDRVAYKALRLSARKKRKLVERDVIQAVLQVDNYGSVTA